MKAPELRERSSEELKELLFETQQQVAELRFAGSHKRTKNVKQLASIKKDIARILTLLRI